ncbi:MAG: response regulator [Methyloceanibacter sp.]|uniref:response regulator n=1 Tax=Methyloceanibacter sp. TaxID=1965321 RepID=UPI003D9AE92A
MSDHDANEVVPIILVVDDEFLIRALLSDHLQECGFKVLEAASADEAIGIIQNGDFSIDLVLTDIRMPGPMDGFGLARWLHTHRPGLPVILTSGNSKKAHAVKELCEERPFFEKPYDMKEVLAQVRVSLESSRAVTD